jgi:hypothetical protein
MLLAGMQCRLLRSLQKMGGSLQEQATAVMQCWRCRGAELVSAQLAGNGQQG